MGLRTYIFKTKVMANVPSITNPTVIIEHERLELVDQYVYIGHVLFFGKEHQQKEITKRLQLGCTAFGKLDDTLKTVDK